jgi:glycosyltransferase involved in cell wall biosynthesis
MTGPGQRVSVSLDVSAVPGRPVGVGRFALDLVRVLARREDVALTLWCRRDDSWRWLEASRSRVDLPHGVPDTAPAAASSGTASEPCTVVRALAPSARPVRLVWEQLRLPGLLSRAQVEVHHGPHYTMPELARLPRVVTIHDLTFLDHPEWHERAKVPVFRRAIRVAARRATALLCDSERTAARLQELCHPEARVFVVPLGVDSERFRPVSPEFADAATSSDVGKGDSELLAQLGVRQPYILFLGTLEPRKAVPELVAAFDSIAGRNRELSLVLAGARGWGADDVDRQVASARHGDRVMLAGYVPDEAVPALLRSAAAVAYPAKEEGFGLPALEALACGAPLVTTSGTVMAELAGEAALTVTPGSVGDLAAALETALSGDGAAERRSLGLEVASRCSWDASAQAHVLAYRWAASQPSRRLRS